MNHVDQQLPTQKVGPICWHWNRHPLASYDPAVVGSMYWMEQPVDTDKEIYHEKILIIKY